MSAPSNRPTAIVTGSSMGIGKALAINLIDKGWNVCFLSRSLNKMQQTASNYSNTNNRIKVIKCDVLQPSQIISACKQIKTWSNDNINLLLNNAGGAAQLGSDVENITIDNWNHDINLNLRSSFIFTQKLLSSLKNASKIPCTYKGNVYDGSIINISSALSSDATSYPCSMAYSVAKAGLEQLTKINAMELSKYKIRVNALPLGYIDTTGMQFSGATAAEEQKMNIEMEKVHPMGRIGTYLDVSEMVGFLANRKQSGWITGAIIDLNGGWNLTGTWSKL
eukprot:330431_1